MTLQSINWSEITFQSLNLVKIVAPCLHCILMEVAIASFKSKLLNVISDQLMDCNVIIDHYRHIAVHKLDRNYVEKLKFGQIVKVIYYCPRNWQFQPKFGQILSQWTVVVVIISSKCQLFIPIMLCESLESVG